MKKNIRTLLSLLLVLTLVASIFAGCSSSDPEPTAPEVPTTAVDNSPIEDPNTDEAAPEASGDQIVVTCWSWLPTTIQWDNMVKAFEAEHPNIKVDYVRTENEDYFEKLQVAMASGTGPDVFGLTTDAKLEQYAPFVEPMDILADEYMPGWKDIISTTAIEQSSTEDGVVAGMPMLVAGMNYMLYNKTLMDEVGVDSVPKTYEEMLDATAKAKEAGYVSVAMGAADDWQNSDWFVWASNQFEPGAVYQAEKGERSFTDQVFVDTMAAYAKFFESGVFEDGALGVATYPDARDQYFYERKALFFPTGSWHLGATSTSNDEVQGTAIHTNGDVIGMSTFPTVGPEGFKAITGVDIVMSVNKDCKNKEAAMTFIEFMSTGTGQQMWVDTLQGSPVANTIAYNGDIDGELQQESIDELNKLNGEAIGARKLSNSELDKAIVVGMQNVAAGADPLKELETIQSVAESIN